MIFAAPFLRTEWQSLFECSQHTRQHLEAPQLDLLSGTCDGKK